MAFIIGSGWDKNKLSQVGNSENSNLSRPPLTSLMTVPVCSGGHDPSHPRHPDGAHPRAVGAPRLPPAGQRLHPAVALPAVPALFAGPVPCLAHLRGIPGALLPQGRLQKHRPVDHRRVQHALSGDGVQALRAGVRSAEQREHCRHMEEQTGLPRQRLNSGGRFRQNL